MGSVNTNEFKSGVKILIDGDPYTILENEMVKPGKGQAFNRVRVKNLKTQRVVEKTWKSGDSAETADVVDTDSMGCGVRVLVDGCWGFCATQELTKEGVGTAAREAVAIAKANRIARDRAVSSAWFWTVPGAPARKLSKPTQVFVAIPLPAATNLPSWKPARSSKCLCSSIPAKPSVVIRVQANMCRA